MNATARAIGAGFLSAAALVALGAVPATAAEAPPRAQTPEKAASAPATLDTLSRFFARDGALARSAARPRIEEASVPVRVLSPEFVAGKAGAPVARVEFHASKAVASDGQTASLWTARRADGDWQVVNIATGDDEIRYADQGARALPGGIVFREPQIDAWYVQKGAKVLPLDEDAVRAVGRNGTSLAAYRDRVVKAYGAKLPGSAYARKGAAGGYDTGSPAHEEPLVTAAAATAGAGAVLAMALIGARALRRRRTA
ncbi:hypothetical protein M5362_18265 [Streptomyces sp. Je 1-79]|uniref:hypothetical protein n=1 Tax=Streptomyces sp. Je 1-79 TaxID=2943847 RepID=UPI0021A6753D|nr:hypothetical protein [Streptomyces sp. Je 1-79]MCT4355078.1 hypothetical protein [Streptomyces sp. Je 1-79]